jgi:hypothetical protein
MMDLALHYFQVIFLHAVKSNNMGRWLSPPKKGMLWIFIALKNLSPWPDYYLRTLGPMASTLTITPLR